MDLSALEMPSLLKNVWKIIKDPQWLVAIGTFLTYRLVRQEIRSRQEEKNIATLEDIVKPLHMDLIQFAYSLERLSIPSSISRGGRAIMEEYPIWNEIKQEHFYLLSNLKKEIIDKLNNFSFNIKKLIYLYNQNFEELTNVFVDVLKPITERDSYSRGAREGICYQISIGGKSIEVFIPHLLFLDKTLEEFLEEVQRYESLPNKKIGDEAFIINGGKRENLSREDFDDILLTVKQRISEKPDLQEFIEETRKIYKEVDSLINSLEKEKERLAKI